MRFPFSLSSDHPENDCMMADSFLAHNLKSPSLSPLRASVSIERLLYLTMSIWIHPILQVPLRFIPGPPL